MMIYFYSTVNVFDGDLSEIKVESSPTNAESDYGIYKAKCEKIIGGYDKGNIIKTI